MRNRLFTIMIAGILSFLAGCSEKEPFTILFTGDDQGRLVPSG